MNHITLQVQVCIQEEFLIIFNIHNIVSKKYKYTKKPQQNIVWIKGTLIIKYQQ